MNEIKDSVRAKIQRIISAVLSEHKYQTTEELRALLSSVIHSELGDSVKSKVIEKALSDKLLKEIEEGEGGNGGNIAYLQAMKIFGLDKTAETLLALHKDFSVLAFNLQDLELRIAATKEDFPVVPMPAEPVDKPGPPELN